MGAVPEPPRGSATGDDACACSLMVDELAVNLTSVPSVPSHVCFSTFILDPFHRSRFRFLATPVRRLGRLDGSLCGCSSRTALWSNALRRSRLASYALTCSRTALDSFKKVAALRPLPHLIRQDFPNLFHDFPQFVRTRHARNQIIESRRLKFQEPFRQKHHAHQLARFLERTFPVLAGKSMRTTFRQIGHQPSYHSSNEIVPKNIDICSRNIPTLVASDGQFPTTDEALLPAICTMQTPRSQAKESR